MSFKTDYKDEIPQNGKRLYNIIDDKTGAVINQNVRVARSNSNTQNGDEFGAVEVNEIHKCLNDMTNPNLLVNGDFQIWQRGEAFSDKNQLINKYTADRWRVNHKNLTSTLRILKNNLSYGMYIDKKNTAGEVEICQILENADLYIEEYLTVSICVLISGKKITDSYTIKLTTGIAELMKTNSQYYFGFRYLSGTNQLVIAFGIKSIVDCSVEWIKMEAGETATNQISRSYKEDLLACQRYYVYLRDIYVGRYWTNAYLGLYFPVEMRVNPTVKYQKVMSSTWVDVSSQTTMNDRIDKRGFRSVTTTSEDGPMLTIQYLELDAEIY